jgi:hypothetical protein
MRRLKTAAAVLSILAVTLLPAAGAILQLGAGLAAIDRMHGRSAAAGPATLEMVGTFAADPGGGGALRLHPARVVGRP